MVRERNYKSCFNCLIKYEFQEQEYYKTGAFRAHLGLVSQNQIYMHVLLSKPKEQTEMFLEIMYGIRKLTEIVLRFGNFQKILRKKSDIRLGFD